MKIDNETVGDAYTQLTKFVQSADNDRLLVFIRHFCNDD